MNTNKMIGIGLLVVGVILLYFGFNASNAPVEEISEALTGQYSDRTMFYFVGGGVAAALGIFSLVRK